MKIYKPGDKVIIRKDLTPGQVYGSMNATIRMCEFAGKECTIISLSDKDVFVIKEYFDKYHNAAYFTQEMFENKNTLDEMTLDVLESIKNLEID
jgi:hypothetical protein